MEMTSRESTAREITLDIGSGSLRYAILAAERELERVRKMHARARSRTGHRVRMREFQIDGLERFIQAARPVCDARWQEEMREAGFSDESIDRHAVGRWER
jgi:hypothetical protein